MNALIQICSQNFSLRKLNWKHSFTFGSNLNFVSFSANHFGGPLANESNPDSANSANSCMQMKLIGLHPDAKRFNGAHSFEPRDCAQASPFLCQFTYRPGKQKLASWIYLDLPGALSVDLSNCNCFYEFLFFTWTFLCPHAVNASTCLKLLSHHCIVSNFNFFVPANRLTAA